MFIFGLKIFIQNVVLRVSRTKNSKIFTCRYFFLVFLMKCSTKFPANLLCPQKFLVVRLKSEKYRERTLVPMLVYSRYQTGCLLAFAGAVTFPYSRKWTL